MNIYLNGAFVAPEAASVSVMDRGFLFGDGIYEVIPVYQREPFYWPSHLERLKRSLAGIEIPNPHTDEEWRAIIDQLIAQNESDDQYLYLQITRGAPAKRDHAFSRDLKPTVMGITNVLPKLPAHYYETGIQAITATDTRWANCHLKTIALLPNILLRQAAVDQGVTEAILIRDGMLTDGAASNILVVKDGQLFSPLRDHRILWGITLEVIEQLAKEHHIPLTFRDISVEELKAADEVWLAASTKEVLPITAIDGQPVGKGQPGPLFHAMRNHYQAHKTAMMPAA